MFNKLREQTSQFLITGIISLIIIGFMFTGYQSFQSTPDTVAEVGGEKISYSEYRSALDRQIKFFTSQFGGKPLTNKQIEQFQLKQRTIDGLVSQKLIKVLADELKNPSSQELIIKTIKEIPAFKSGEQFDVNRYKQVLAANRLTPKDFEASVADGIASDSVREILTKSTLSKDLINKVMNVKKNSKEVDIVKINKKALKRKIVINKKELSSWLKSEENMKKVSEKFQQVKAFRFDKKEQVKARHILLRANEKNQAETLKKILEIRKGLTKKNFARMANKHSMDPSNQKKKGGTLGWFAKGRMVPEFEKVAFNLKPGSISSPVKTSYGYHIIYVEGKKPAKEAKLNDHKDQLAIEMMQDSSDEKSKTLLKKTVEEVSEILKRNNKKEISRYVKKNNAVKFYTSQKLNLFEKTSQLSTLTSGEINDLFRQTNGSLKKFSTAIQETLVAVRGDKVNEKATFESVEKELKSGFLRQNTQIILNKLKEMYPPKVMANRL